MSKITIYTDGAYNPTTQCGRWAAIIFRGDRRQIISGTTENTSSNRMELTAVIRALESIEPAGQRVEIRSDSEYVVRCVNQWLPGWVRNRWVTSRRKPVANRDLWQQMRELLICHNVTMVWIPRGQNVADGVMSPLVKSRCFVALCLVLLIFTPLAAQETTPDVVPPTSTATTAPTPMPEPPTDTPTATLTATSTATMPPTSTPTAATSPTDVPETTEDPQPSATHPPEQTAEVTPEVLPSETKLPTATDTAELTPEVTVEPMPTATLSPEPALTAIYSTTFDDGDLSAWQIGAGWQLVPVDGGLALGTQGSLEPVTFMTDVYRDLAVEMNVQLSEANIEIGLRQSESGGYTLRIEHSGQITVHRDDVLLATYAHAPFQPGIWQQVRFSAMDAALRVAIDGVEVIAVQDDVTLPAGHLTLSASPSGITLVDNLRVWLPETDVITDTPAAPVDPVIERVEMELNARDMFHQGQLQTFEGLNVPAIQRIPGLNDGEIGIIPTQSASEALSVQQTLPEDPIFVQDFDADPPTDPQEVDDSNYESWGFPRHGIGSCLTNPNQSVPPQACAQYLSADAAPTDLYLGVTLPLGDDPDQLYQVQNYVFDSAFENSPAITFSKYIIVQMVGAADEVLFQGTCFWDAAVGERTACGVDPDLPYTTFPVPDVDKITFFVMLASQIPSGTNLSYYNLTLDNIKVYTESPDICPAATGLQAGIQSQSECPGDPVQDPIVFVSNTTPDNNQEIYLATDDVVQNLTNDAHDDTNPAFSPDGSQIVFQSNRSGNWDIYLMKTDGTEVRQLTTNTADDEYPIWSPDGTRIAFAREGTIVAVYTIGNPDEQTLYSQGTGVVSDLSWSPDGRWISFIQDGNLHNLSILCESDCHQQLTTTGGFEDPSWSPDATRIAIAENGDLKLYDVNFNTNIYQIPIPVGLDPTSVITMSGESDVEELSLTWAPNGKYVVFQSDSDGSQHLYRLDEPFTGQATKVIEGGFSPAISQYTPCGDPNNYSLITQSSPSPYVRRSCLWTYNGSVYYAMYNEARKAIALDEIPAFATEFGFTDANTANFPTGTLYHPYYIYARAAINGVESYAMRGANPMNFFATNFSSTVSLIDPDVGRTSDLDGDGQINDIETFTTNDGYQFVETMEANGDIHDIYDNNPGWLGGSITFQCTVHIERNASCVDKQFFNQLLISRATLSQEEMTYYRRMLPHLWSAVHDEAFSNFDPVFGGQRARTANVTLTDDSNETTVITFTTQVAGFDSKRNYTPSPAEQQISIRYMAHLDFIYGYPVEILDPTKDDDFAVECILPFETTTGDGFPARIEAGRHSGANAVTFGVSRAYTLYITYIEADRDSSGEVTGLSSLKWVTATFSLGDEINTVNPPVQKLSAFGVVWPANQYLWVPNPTLDFDFLLPKLTHTSQC